MAPTDEKLETLMDAIHSASEHLALSRMSGRMGAVRADSVELDAARAALREYVSATTLTEEDGRAILHSLRFGSRLPAASLDKVRNISARRASMKEQP